MTRTLTCDRCHKDTDHLNPVYDDLGERSVILDWCDECCGEYSLFCPGCKERVRGSQMAFVERTDGHYICLACRRPAPTDEGARLRNAMREAKVLLEKAQHQHPMHVPCVICESYFILSNALEGDAPVSKKEDTE